MLTYALNIWNYYNMVQFMRSLINRFRKRPDNRRLEKIRKMNCSFHMERRI